jgi:hypothetical protein
MWIKKSFTVLKKNVFSCLWLGVFTHNGDGDKEKRWSLLEILSFATSHYATGMQLIVICNYLGHICNYKFGIV